MFYRTKVEILSNDTQSIMQYHTSNAGSKDGLRDGCVIYDEIHRYENFDVVNVFSSGLGKVPNAREFLLVQMALSATDSWTKRKSER